MGLFEFLLEPVLAHLDLIAVVGVRIAQQVDELFLNLVHYLLAVRFELLLEFLVVEFYLTC